MVWAVCLSIFLLIKSIYSCLGFLPVNQRTLFLVGCFLVRGVVALGGTAWFIAGVSIAMDTFKERMSTVIVSCGSVYDNQWL